MGAIVSILTGILTGKAGEKIGGTVASTVQLGAILAALAPIALWLTENKDGVFLTVTYGQLAFWGVLMAGFVVLVVRLVHRAPPPP